MYLTYRTAQPSDFAAGFSYVKARYGYKDSIRKDMFKIWRVLLENGHGPMVVSEDRDRPAGKRLVSFGSAFFAYDWFLNEARTDLPPFLDLRVLEKWRAGKRPFLLKDEIGEAQLKGGLNSLAFNWGWDEHRPDPQESLKIAETQSQSFIQVVSSYRLKSFTQEVKGDWERDRLMNYGVDHWRDYHEFLGTRYLPNRKGEDHPYLMGMVMEEVRQNKQKAGTAADHLARLGPPRYGFELKEQAVLRQALEGRTDEEIAHCLNLTLVTVKRRWQGIYEKVTAVENGFFDNGHDNGNGENGAQKQRRRCLLQSLGTHPEELWPNEVPRRKGQRRKSKD